MREGDSTRAVWNCPPKYARDSPSVKFLKHKLNIYIFTGAFNSEFLTTLRFSFLPSLCSAPLLLLGVCNRPSTINSTTTTTTKMMTHCAPTIQLSNTGTGDALRGPSVAVNLRPSRTCNKPAGHWRSGSST